ncbi:MAG: hypothetical protein K5679_09020 [Lachnospiraceae bacterium]|nr:hypothetical protein [Lachnospiraceae bacterium]
MSVKKTLNVALPFALLAIVFGLVIKGFFGITNIIFAKYVFTQCFLIMVPGMVCVKYLLGDKIKSVINWISLSYAFGYALNLLEYIIIWGLKLQQFATAIMAIVTVFLCFLWFFKPIKVELDEVKNDDYAMLFLFMIYMVINVIAYSGNNISPFSRGGGTTITRDVQFWCANAVSLKKSFLPQSAFFSGTTFFYHYFSSMQIAFISQVSGIPVFDLAFTWFSFGKSILLVGSLNYLIDRYKFGPIKYLFHLCILFMTGWEMKPVVTFLWHLNYNPFGFDIGFAYGLLLVAFVLELIENPKFELRKFIAVMLIWITLTGAKGPIAALLILVPGLACFMWLFQKKFKMAFGYGVSFLVVFTVVNIFCVGIIRVLNHTAESQAANVGAIRTIQEIVAGTPYPNSFKFVIPALIWHAFYSHPVIFILSVISIILLMWLLFSKRIDLKSCGKIWILLAVAMIGFALGRFYNAGGRSEMYFTMAAYIPWLAFDLEVYNEAINRGMVDIKWMAFTYKSVFVLMSLIGIYCWAFTDYQGGIITPLSTGYHRIQGNYGLSADSGTFTEREAQACVWIRENTSSDSVVQSNRFISYPSGSYFVSIFSERIQYLEESFLIYYSDTGIDEIGAESKEVERRSELISKAYSGNIDALNQLVEEGVDYFIQDNLLGEDRLADMGLTEIFNQNDIVIYATD